MFLLFHMNLYALGFFNILDVTNRILGRYIDKAIIVTIMKRLLYILFLFVTVQGFGQEPLPQEMVFVHMDNTCYFLGDTLFYKAYVQRSDTGKPTNLSEVLYVELLNQDGYLVERQVLRLKGGQANSSFCLEDTLYAGFYELRAYTRWQLNFGRKEHPHDQYINRWFLKKEYAKEFFVDYDKLYSRVFPVYDKPQEPGEFYRDMTIRPLRRDYAPEKISKKPAVSLFPEGGNLINDTRQRVAFEVKDGEGKYVDGKLFVLNEKGDTISSAITENRGRGCFELNIRKDDKYKAFFEDKEGEQTKVSLPDILLAGAAMKVEQDASSVKADINIQGIERDSILLLVTTCGRPRMKIPFEGNAITVSKDSLTVGVAQLTLVKGGDILADRLIFVHRPDQQEAPLQILGMKENYEPLEQVSLKVQGKSNASLSVSVRDNVSSDLVYDNGNIMTEMLLSSHIKGFVENPGYYFEADDSEHQRHLDLLLMVQGWRRFDIKQPEIVEPYEKSQMIVGDVCKYTPLDQEDGFFLGENGMRETLECPIPLWLQVITDSISKGSISVSRMGETYEVEFLYEPGKQTHLHTEFVQPGFSPVYGDITVKENGKFSIQAPHFGGYCLMHLAASSLEKLAKADKKDEKKKSKGKAWEVAHQWLMPNANEFAEYSIRVHRCFPRFAKPYEYFQQQFMSNEEADSEANKIGEVTNLREVKVKARRRILRKVDLSKPAVVMDVYDAYNQLVDAGLTGAFFAGSWSFSDILCRLLVGDMGQERGNIEASRRWDGRTIYMNSIQVKDEQLKYNHLENLSKVYVYTDYSPRKEGSDQFWGANKPEVIVDLHRFLDDSKRVTYRDRFIVLDGYATSADFYHPDYSKHKLPEGQKDYRRTLYWNPDLKLDENGEANISFYNNSRQTTLSVEAEGQAPDGTLLWTK